MKLYIRSSIKTKLTVLIMAICAILLFVVGGVFLFSELFARQATIKQQNKILATSLAEQVRHPLVLENFKQAEQLLQALSRQNNVHGCYLFDRNGKAVAEYLITDRTAIVLPALKHDFAKHEWPIIRHGELNFARNYYSSFTPIFFNGKQVGTLYLLSDLKAFYSGINGALIGFGMAFVVLIFLSFFLAGAMQKPVSDPLLKLAYLMKLISEKKDYTLRAVKQTDDEIGILVDGFNTMLDQVEQHQRALGEHQNYLENAVKERTQELSRANEKLEFARQQADGANQAKSDFLSRMTHELRTPLIGVLGMNELLMRTSLDSHQQSLVGTVANSGHQLLQLISDVLDFSKIEANKLTLNVGEVELFRIVENCVELLAPQAFEKGLQLVADIPLSSTYMVYADEVRVRQILMNLIGNAIKFTYSGHIIVRLICPEENTESHDLILEVEDSGEGIDDTSVAEVFEAFHQVDGTHTREKTGAGLGLSIVKQLVELMNGRINVDTSPSGGTVFRLFLPFPALSYNKLIVLPEELTGAQVLICASEDFYSRVLVRNLHQLGLSVHFFKEAEDVLVYLASMHNRSTELMFCFINSGIIAKDVLNALIRQNRNMSDLRVFWLRYDLAQSVDIPPDEQLLTLPISWDGILKALSSSSVNYSDIAHFKQKRLVGANLKQALTGTILFSQNAASRELLRLSLKPVLKVIKGVGDLNFYDLEPSASVADKNIFIFDVDHLDVVTMKEFLRHSQNALCILIGKGSPLSFEEDCYDLWLRKPLIQDGLIQLRKFLTANGISVSGQRGGS